MNIPEPVLDVAVEPKTAGDRDKLHMALARVAEEDPSLKVSTDPETEQLIVSGMGELHLEIVTERLVREHGVEATVGRPQVAYRETVKSLSKAEGRFVKQSGGRGQYGHVVLEICPLARGKGFEFTDSTRGGVIPAEYMSAVEKGVLEVMSSGILAGYPMVDVGVSVLDGSYHEVDSSTTAFTIAGSMAFRKAAEKSGMFLLEPVMLLEVSVPEQYLGEVIADLNSRRAHIFEAELMPDTSVRIVKARIPLSETFGYVKSLRSLTQGRAVFSMWFSEYQKAPPKILETL
jgi:elongation factor G